MTENEKQEAQAVLQVYRNLTPAGKVLAQIAVETALSTLKTIVRIYETERSISHE